MFTLKMMAGLLVPWSFWILTYFVFTSKATKFPIEKFFNVNRSAPLSQYMCHMDSYKKVCHCGSECMRSKSCCIDMFWNETSTIDLNTYLQTFVNHSSRFNRMSCEHVVPSLENNKHTSERLLMIKSCPKSLNRASRNWSNQNDIPVLGKDNYVYRSNLYAECNSIEYGTPFLSVRCKSPLLAYRYLTNITSMVALGYAFENCTYELDRPVNTDYYFRRCYNNTCSPKNEHYDLCSSYMGVFENYQNYHCFKCNNPSNLSSPINISQSVSTNYVESYYTSRRKSLFLYPWTYRLFSNENKEWEVAGGERSFPIIEFFNISQSPESLPVEILNAYTCAGYSPARCCSCDEDCVRLKTCCIDKLWEPEKPLPLKSYLEMFVGESVKYKDLACKHILPKEIISGYDSEKIMMVDSCSEGAKYEDVINCKKNRTETLLDSLPVFAADKNIYKNSYCAKCNFAKNFQMVNITVNCSTKKWFGSRNDRTSRNFSEPANQKCFYQIARNRFITPFIRQCKYEVSWNIGKVCNKSNPFHDLCMSYMAKNSLYANYHCFLCNSDGPAGDILPYMRECYRTLPIITAPFLPFSFLITLSGTSKSGSKSSNPVACGDDQIYDFIQRRCIAHTCLEKYHLVNNICVLNVNLTNPTFDRCLVSQTPRLFAYIRREEFNESKTLKLSPLAKDIRFHDFSTYFQGNYFTIGAEAGNVSEERFTALLNSHSKWSRSTSLKVDKFVIYPFQKPTVSLLHDMDLSRSYPGGRICAVPVSIHNEVNFTTSCDIFVNDTRIKNVNLSFWIEFRNGVVERRLFTCHKFYLNPNQCKLEILSTLNTTIDGDLTLLYRSGNEEKRYPVDNYVPLKGGVGICSSFLKPVPEWIQVWREIEGYLTVGLICVSLCCYILIIIIFSLFKELRIGAGLSALTMCVCLLAADGLFLVVSVLHATVSQTPPLMCGIFGVLLHYALLAAFTWSLLIALSIAYSFHRLDGVQRGGNRFLKSCLVAFLTPLVIVCISVVFHVTNALYVGYGDENACFIRGVYAKLIFYIVPAGLVIFINLAAFIFIVTRINKTKKENAAMLGDQNKVNLSIVAIKLAVVFGLSELPGFIYIPNPDQEDSAQIFNAVFGILYSILRSARGIVLFFLYVVRPQVWKLYKRRFKKNVKTNSHRLHTITLSD